MRLDDKNITILSMDMRKFKLREYFFLLNSENVSLNNVSTSRRLLRRAIANYFKDFKIFRNVRSRKFLINSIFIMEAVSCGVVIPEIVCFCNFYLELLGFQVLSVSEEEAAKYTFQVVLNSFTQGTLEAKYAHWLNVLYFANENQHGFMTGPEILEQQMFSSKVQIEDADYYLEQVKEMVDNLPNSEERNDWKKVAEERLPGPEQWKTISKGFEDIGSISCNIESAIPQLKILNSNIAQLKSESSALKGTLNRGLAKAETFAEIAMDLLICGTMGWAVYKLMFNKDQPVIFKGILVGAGMLATTHVTTDAAKKFLVASSSIIALDALFSSFSTSSSELDEDVLERQSFSIADLSKLFEHFVSYVRSIKWGSLPRKILDSIRVCNELPKFIKQVYELIKGYINSAWIYFFKVPLFTPSGISDKGYTEQIDTLFQSYYSDKMEHSFATASHVRSLINQTVSFMDETKEFGKRKVLDNTLKVLNEIDKELLDIRYTMGGSRIEPVTIMFEGAPGTKKTIWSRFLSVAIVKAVRRGVVDPNKEIYVKPQGDYWSEYKNQLITCFDDFGQVRDSVGDPREKGELINLYNTVPYPLNMNQNDDKGKVYFTSSYLVMTGNSAWDECPSIISPEALRRRIDLTIHIKKIKEDNRVIQGVEDISPENYTFGVSYRRNGKTVTNHISFEELLKVVLKLGGVKEHHYRVFMKAQDRLVDLESIADGIDKIMDQQTEQIDSYFDNKLSSQSGDLQDNFSDLEMQEISYVPDVSTYVKEFPSVKHRLGPLQSGYKNSYGYDFECEFYDDMDELEYEAAERVIKSFICKVLEDLWPQISSQYDTMKRTLDIDLRYLELHYGARRSKLFLIEYMYAKEMYGESLQQLVQRYVKITSSQNRGYYMSEKSILMNIWLCDREKFYCLIIDPDAQLEDMVQYHGFARGLLLSDWRISLKQRSRQLYDNLKKNFDTLSKIVSESTSKAATRMAQALQVDRIPTKEETVATIAKIEMAVAALLVLSPFLVALHGYVMQKHFKKKPQSSQLYYKDKSDKPGKMSLGQAIKAASMEQQGGVITPQIVKLEKNSATISIKDGNNSHTLGKVTYLDTIHLLMPLHYFEDVLSFRESTFIISDSEGPVELTFSDLVSNVNVVETQELEFCIIRTTKFKKTRKNIVPNFVTREQLKQLPGKFDIALAPYTENVIMTSSAHISSLHMSGKTFDKMIKYNVDTGKGDCGSLIYLITPQLGNNVICGMHEAGTPKGAFSTTAGAFIITQDDILEAFTKFEDEPVEEQGALLSTEKGHNPYQTTKIVPSALAHHPLMHVKQAPAKLLPSKDGECDPFKIAISKYKEYPMNFDANTLQFATEELVGEYTSFMYVPTYGDTVPYEKCFYGDPMHTYMRAVPTSTSVGYPLKNTNRYAKLRMKEQGPEGREFKKFLKELEEEEQLMSKGVRCNFIHTANLKDETRDLEKVLKYKTRAFFGAPLKLVMHTKKYFGEFFIFMMEDCIHRGTAMAVNPHSKDWKRIVQRLSSFSLTYDSVVCKDFDYSHFDGSNNPCVLNCVLDIINSWYDHHGIGQSNKIRSILFKEITNFKYIVGTDIVEMVTSLPSGSFLTLLVNCLTNRLLLRYAFYRICPAEINYSCVMIDIVQGDDNVVAISPEMKKLITPAKIANAISELGFEITNADKSAVSDEWSNINEVTFLKRKFDISTCGIIRAPLSTDTIWNTLHWSKKGPLFSEITANNIEFFYREYSQHGRDTFDENVNILRFILKDFPDFNVFPPGKAHPWNYWDWKVRHTDFLGSQFL